jgi:anti-sigma B factor antagonist
MKFLDIEDKDDVVVVTFKQARITDEGSIQQIGDEFKTLTMEAAADKKLLLNFQRVEHMSSSMIGQIVKLHKQCNNDKIKLKLCSISPNIVEIFRITRLDKLLDIRKDEEDAINSFGPGKRRWLGLGG